MIDPTYILDSKEFLLKYNKFSEFADVFYPVKCNDNINVISLLKSYESNFEIETYDHLLLLNKMNISPNKVLFYSPFSTEKDLVYAINLGVRFFVIDKLQTLMLLDSFGVKYDYLIRFDVGNEICDTHKRFGATIEQVYSLVGSSINGTFNGFSFYINAEFNNMHSRNKIIEKLLSLNVEGINIINIGGGVPDCEMLETYEKINSFSNCRIIIEPGRFLLDPCISLKSTVIKKEQIDGKKVLFLNVGIYNGLLDIIIKNKRFETLCDNSNEKMEKYLLFGPTGDCSDIIGEYNLPSSIGVGDKIIFKECGAYCEVFCTDFYMYNKNNFIIK